jgi:hypothetical protein
MIQTLKRIYEMNIVNLLNTEVQYSTVYNHPKKIF